jgi:hypothetical protein
MVLGATTRKNARRLSKKERKFRAPGRRGSPASLPTTLFGCDRDRPFARIDHIGLLWLLNARKLVALTETTAAIETTTGATQRYWRKPAEPCQCLAWELEPLP